MGRKPNQPRVTRTTCCELCGRKGRTERPDLDYRCRRCERVEPRLVEPVELTGGRWVLIAGVFRWIADSRQEAA